MATWHWQVDPLQPQIDTQRSGEASQYTPDPLVASFQEQELKLPPSLDLNWAQRVKTGNPTTLHPPASGNLDTDFDHDFLRSDDVELGWDTEAIEHISSSKGGVGRVRRHGNRGGRGKGGGKARGR